MPSDLTERNLKRAARLLADADALLITAGAGMGVDSGLPDFRGRDGFWRGYPALGKRGLSFEQMAQPKWFVDDPETAWAFYGHRQQLYRGTTPHDGFRMLLEWARAMRGGYFVATSNVDEQFEAAGFAAERVLAVHGTLFAYQCLAPCRKETWREEPLALDIDLETMQAGGRLPCCPHCGGVARPNVLLFDDGAWVSKDRDLQRGRYLHWLAGLKGRRVVVLEVARGQRYRRSVDWARISWPEAARRWCASIRRRPSPTSRRFQSAWGRSRRCGGLRRRCRIAARLWCVRGYRYRERRRRAYRP